MSSLARLLPALALGACGALHSGSARASIPDLFGFGARSTGMAGTGVAVADDVSAVWANPAGLSRGRERTLTLGYSGVLYDLYTRRAMAPSSAFSVDNARGITIGVLAPLPFGGPLRDRLALGIGFYTPTGVIARGRLLAPETPQFLVVGDRTQTVSIQVALGAELPFGFRVGAGVSALAAVLGDVLVSADSTGRTSSRVDNQLVTSFAPVVGASWERGPFRVGLAFRGTLVGRFAVTVAARDLGLPLPTFNIAGIAQYDPWQLAPEVGLVFGPLTVALGVTFKAWSGYPGPLEATTPRSTPPPAANFHDTLVPRVGLEYRRPLGRALMAARVGYFYENSPRSNAMLQPTSPLGTNPDDRANWLDNDRHAVALGYSLSAAVLGTRLGLELYAQLHFLAERTTTKLTATAMDNPGYPSLTYGGALYHLGFNTTVSF